MFWVRCDFSFAADGTGDFEIIRFNVEINLTSGNYRRSERPCSRQREAQNLCYPAAERKALHKDQTAVYSILPDWINGQVLAIEAFPWSTHAADGSSATTC